MFSFIVHCSLYYACSTSLGGIANDSLTIFVKSFKMETVTKAFDARLANRPFLVFSKRQRITLRLLYAMSRPSVVWLSVVCLSVCLWRWCALLRRLNFSAIFFHHTIAQGLYFSGAKNRWWGTPLSPWNLRSKWPTPFKQRNFDKYRLIAPQPE